MALPDFTTYRQLSNGYFVKISDLSGPYVWDGTTMEMVDAEGGEGAGDASAANQATEIALLGTKTTSVTALEAGGTGIIGWLSQSWRDLVALSAKLPTSLGIKTASASLSVVPASDATHVVAGGVASGAADSGNPVKIGGVYNSTLPALTNGQRGDLQITANGVTLATPLSSASSPGDGLSNTNVTAPLHAGSGSTVAATRMLPLVFNGTTWDRIRSGVVTPTATLTGHQNTLPWAVYNATPTTRTEGQGGPLQADTTGRLQVAGRSAAFADGDSGSNTARIPANELGETVYTAARGFFFNGTTWDRARGNTTGAWVQGPAAHDAAIQGAPVRGGYRALTANYTAVATGDSADAVSTLVGAVIQKPYSIPEEDWAYAAATGGISNTTTAVTIKAAGAAGIRNYITGLQVSSDVLGTATELAIRDGAGGAVLWRMKIGTAGIVHGQISFPSPIKGTAATLLEVVTLTASGTGAVFVNAQGYQAP